MKYGMDRYGNKIQLSDDSRAIQPQKRTSIFDLLESDTKARSAQKTDVVEDGRKDLVVDANDDLNAFVKNQGKVVEEAQDADVIFEFSSPANDKAGEFSSDKSSVDKKDLKGDVKKSTDKREEYVAEAPADDLSAFESAQSKTQKAAEKIDDSEKKVKDRWAKLVTSMLFDPFQLDGKKGAVAFKIGKDYVIMKSQKPTRTEWITARALVSELRDPSILRTAQKMEDEVSMDEVAVDAAPEASPEVANEELPEGYVQEEKTEVEKLGEVLKLLDEGKVDEAKAMVQECLAANQEEVVEAEEEMGEGEMEQFQGGEEEAIPEAKQVPSEVVAKKKQAVVDPIAASHKMTQVNEKTDRTKKTPESATKVSAPTPQVAMGVNKQVDIQD